MCSTDDVEAIESLRWEDQQRIRNYVESGGPSNAKTATPQAMEYAIEVSKASRATCKGCSQKIMKGEVGCLCLMFYSIYAFHILGLSLVTQFFGCVKWNYGLSVQG